MIDQSQLSNLIKKYQTNSTVIIREYVQLLFLESLYALKGSKEFIFKGGTAVHLIYGAPRFSEDLDFTVLSDEKMATSLINKLFVSLTTVGNYTFKQKDSISGLRYMMTINPGIVNFTIYMNLDFSFREQTLSHEKTIIETEFPITTNSLIHHMHKDEIVSEKIRAILTRQKGRDIYDLWYLLNKGAQIKLDWINSKFTYYGDKNLQISDTIDRIKNFPLAKFIEDLRPFVSMTHRDQLADRFTFIQSDLIKRLDMPKHAEQLKDNITI